MAKAIFIIIAAPFFASAATASEHCHETKTAAPVSHNARSAGQPFTAKEIPGALTSATNGACPHHPGMAVCSHALAVKCGTEGCCLRSAMPFAGGINEKSAGQEEAASLDASVPVVPEYRLQPVPAPIFAGGRLSSSVDPRPPSA